MVKSMMDLEQAIYNRARELDLGQLDKYIIDDAGSCEAFEGFDAHEIFAALESEYKLVAPCQDHPNAGRNEVGTWAYIMKRALHRLLKNKRTEGQKEIDSWIVKNVPSGALDCRIKAVLSEFPRFKFTGKSESDILAAIEGAYLSITPEEEYDSHVWTTVVQRALAILQPYKGRLYKVVYPKFGEYSEHVKEMTVGMLWLEQFVDDIDDIHKCQVLGVGETLKTSTDAEDIVVTRIA